MTEILRRMNRAEDAGRRHEAGAGAGDTEESETEDTERTEAGSRRSSGADSGLGNLSENEPLDPDLAGGIKCTFCKFDQIISV